MFATHISGKERQCLHKYTCTHLTVTREVVLAPQAFLSGLPTYEAIVAVGHRQLFSTLDVPVRVHSHHSQTAVPRVKAVFDTTVVEA